MCSTTRPERAREALGSIESTGREALVELRRLLGVVGPADDDDGVDCAPQPGLARLPELIEQVSAAGLRVELTVGGEPRDLPPGVDLSAYRIVQEALTNTLKHADAPHAEVRDPADADADSSSRSSTTARAARSPGPGAGSSACASASRCSAASCRPGRAPAGLRGPRDDPAEEAAA